MAIVYIGPYRQYDYIGQTSINYIDSIYRSFINNNKELICRPLFLDHLVADHSYAYSNIKEYISENIKITSVIQHAPVEYLAIQKYATNIAIPIISNRLHKMPYNLNFQKLNSFDAIMVENEYQKNLLIKSNITSNIHIFEEVFSNSYLSQHNNKKYNLGPKLDGKFIFSFIGQYRTNVSIIQKIINAFLITFRSHDDTVLTIYCRGTEQDKKELDNYYQDIKKRLFITTYDNIMFIFNTLNIESSIAALNSTNCLLSLNDDYAQSLYEKYMLSQNNTIINKYSLDSVQTPSIHVDAYSDIDDVLLSVSTNDLCNKMTDIKHSVHHHNKSHKNKKSNAKNLGESLCHILQ